MYAVGTQILYERRGVYEIESVGAPPMPTEDGCDYYKLRSVFSCSKEIIYIPVDTNAFMRPLINEEQVSEYLELASQLEPQVFYSKKTMDLTSHYRAALSSCKLEDCLLLIKEISTKQKDLSSHGKKLGPVDEQYLKLAERLVCEEFAAVLRTTPDAAKKRLYTEMRRKKSGARKVALQTTVL